MKLMIQVIRNLLFVIGMLFAFQSLADDKPVNNAPPAPVVKVGAYITSIYDIDIPGKKFTITAWLWATYDPNELPRGVKDYKFYNYIEFTNARSWEVSEIERFVLTNSDGTEHSMSKIVAVINQDWDMTDFPFDKQELKINIESVELDSKGLEYVPDTEASKLSDDFKLTEWRTGQFEVRAFDYEYDTTFGQENVERASYPRFQIIIPLERHGSRIFWTYYLGFFVSYIVIITLYFFNKNQIEARVGIIVSAIFATVGNKYSIDLLLPSMNTFTLSDLIQVLTFSIVAIGLFNTVAIAWGNGKEKAKVLVNRIDAVMTSLIAVGYPSILAYAVFMTP